MFREKEKHIQDLELKLPRVLSDISRHRKTKFMFYIYSQVILKQLRIAPCIYVFNRPGFVEWVKFFQA
jgi:hypothetical protein